MPNVNTKIVLVTVVVFLAMLIPTFASVNAQNATNQTQQGQSNQTSQQSATYGTGYKYSNYLTDFSYGQVGHSTSNQTERNYTLMISENTLVPITTENESGIVFPGWTFNSSIPGPTMRMTEGDLVHITVVNPITSKNSHSMHMHSRHEPIMDGTYGVSGDIKPGENFTYTFVAGPAGLYPYHCHVSPIVDHINHGLYGAMIIDPKTPRPAAHEMVMMLNSYDFDINKELDPTFSVPDENQSKQILDIADRNTVDEDGNVDEELVAANLEEREAIELGIERENEMYTVNGKAFEYMDSPINLKLGEPVRIYLLSMTEFDPVNNFHLHSDMFKYTPAGTIDSAPFMTDVVTLAQGDRGIIEFTPQHEGLMMFHSHIAEFAELGWMSNFNVTKT